MKSDFEALHQSLRDGGIVFSNGDRRPTIWRSAVMMMGISTMLFSAVEPAIALPVKEARDREQQRIAIELVIDLTYMKDVPTGQYFAVTGSSSAAPPRSEDVEGMAMPARAYVGSVARP